MRLLLSLESLKNSFYDLKYHHKFQGFVYSHIRPYYEELHDKKGYKFFCFSNLFPIGDMKKGDKKIWIISSPDRAMIKWLNANLPDKVNLGEMQFKLAETKIFDIKIKKRMQLISATPITIRIPRWQFERYNIKENKKYVYWRKNYPFEAFIKQLEDNLFNKFNDFYHKEIQRFPIFEYFIFKKQVCNHVIIENKEVKIIGSIWEFIFRNIDKKKREIIKLGIDSGFGERNSFGFGFINELKKKI